MDTTVVIVGGGPVGLTLANLLDQFEIDCVVVERNPTTTTHPKARGVTQRSMEIFRRLGVEDAIRARGLPSHADSIVFCESLAGREIGRGRPEPSNDDITPSWKSMVAQDVVEEELCRSAQQRHHVKLLFSTEFLRFSDANGGIEATVRPLGSGEEVCVRGRFLVAADGANSELRRGLGIEMVGPAKLRKMANNWWRGDLSKFPATQTNFAFNILPSDPAKPGTFILNTGGSTSWLTSLPVPEDRERRNPPWSKAELVAVVREQVGDPELDVEVLGTAVWTMGMQVAASARCGNVFLVGDALHRLVPVGGFGMNTGIQGALNLAWKLAYAAKGLASDRLLDSYELEHLELAHSNAEWSHANGLRSARREAGLRSGDPDLVAFWLAESERNYHVVGRSLGFAYSAGALILDGTRAEPLEDGVYVPTDRPGARFPHCWLDLSRQRSTLDWFTSAFVLAIGPLGTDWYDAAAAVSEKLNVPLRTEVLPSIDRRDGIHVGPRGAVLVRPDGHVAWRCPYLPRHAPYHLADALTTVLGFSEAAA